jgi:IS5 family transposase
MEDLSDREMERFMAENVAVRWFCGFFLSDKTPDHTVFCTFRKRLGTGLMAELFAHFRGQLKAAGYMSEVFTFVDASHLITKSNLWKERDKAIQAKYEKLNNEVLPKVAADKEARIGCKGQNKFWYGYKKHTSVDMQSGLINKVAITSANITDAQGFRHVAPREGATYLDKGYCTGPAVSEAKRRSVHLAAIKKNNMIGKNFDLDRWISKIRAPFERVFSKEPKRVRYRGIAKNQLAAFAQALCFNLKRALVLTEALGTG